MSVSVTYDPIFGSSTISDYLAFWATGFDTGGHGYTNTGGFNGGNGLLEGDQYAAIGSLGSDYAFVASSNASDGLHYVYDTFLHPSDNANHYLWGQLDNISLGEVLGGGWGSDFSLSNYVVTFSGLDLSAAFGAGRVGNEVHETIFGLMQGDTAPLESVLDDLFAAYGVSTDDSFDVVAAALAAGPLSMGSAETVGVPELADDLALAA